MKHTNNVLRLGALLCAFATTAGGAVAQEQPHSVPTAPLSREDPRAKLDPRLMNVPSAVRLSRRGPALLAQPISREVEHDLITHQTRVATRPVSLNPHILGASTSVSNPGLDSAVQEEPTKSLRPGYVFGTDDRVQETATTSYPWRTQCKIYATFPNGFVAGGSGTLVAAKYVLTAGHVVYDGSKGGWATSVQVIPGLDGAYQPYGSFFATKLRSYTGWTVSANSGDDFALVTLSSTIGNTTGWLGYGYYSVILGVTGNLSGYPGDKGGITQYYDYDPVASVFSKQVYYLIDATPGTSGAGVYKIVSGSRYVFAVNAVEVSLFGLPLYNAGTRIDSAKFNSIKSWIASGI